MTQNEELQRQIDELKATVERLQSGESRFESASVRMRRIRNAAVERYYGNWDYFRETDIQICPTQKTWSDRSYFVDGITRLITIMFKHGKDLNNSHSISCAIKSDTDFKEYEEIANYIVDCAVSKIRELRDRHGIKKESQEATTSQDSDDLKN